MILFIILFSATSIILITNIILLTTFPKFNKKYEETADYLNISIIIAFKNEEKNIEALYSALQSLEYPRDKFEVILVDDGSTDDSIHKALKPFNSKTNYCIIKAEHKKYPGKKGALEIGIGKSKFPYILITDADCLPAKSWLTGYSRKFHEGYDLLFGLAPFVRMEGMINKISCFENLRSHLISFVYAKLNLPYSASARNIGFTKIAFEKVGGFSKTLETLSGDDDLLIREAVRNKLKIGIVDFENSFVLSNTKRTLREYLNQKARHTKTSLYYLLKHQIVLGSWHLANLFALFSIVLFFINPYFIILFLLKFLVDSVVVLFTQHRLHYSFKLFEIPFLQLIYEIFIVINFLSSFRENIPWKN